MRGAYDDFYLKAPAATYYLKGRGYTIEDFAGVVSRIAGTEMSGWFAKYVLGVERLPYDESLAAVGLRLVATPARQSNTAGIALDRRDSQNARLGTLRTGSPAEEA